uniref:Uncharacterized protein n=1 Tax=viral metagenome TaxID=1070528 RepID=A0A6C0DUA8_9ZZZZ
MSLFCSTNLHTQNELLMKSLMEFYKNKDNIQKMMRIINGDSKISLRIVDWFVTNFAKKYYTVYDMDDGKDTMRFKVHNDYKLKLKAYSKRRFDVFCRWERITVPYDSNNYIETTIGQLNFFKWAIENKILEFIEENYTHIENDMNHRNSTSKKRGTMDSESSTDSVDTDSTNGSNNNSSGKTRKKREELSVSACKCIKKETVNIIVKFN